MEPLTLEAIARNPECLTEKVSLPTGEVLVFRLLRPDDAERFGRFLEGLSDYTRMLFAPHPFTVETARRLCGALFSAPTLLFVGEAGEGGQSEIVAYFILCLRVNDAEKARFRNHGISLDEGGDCTVAPCIADAYQNRGLGSLLMPKVLNVAARLGRKRALLAGGTQERNRRGVHFYEKLGFRKVGDFPAQINNHDMILPLA